MEDGETPTTLPLSKQHPGTFPSAFFTTSPLFSTIGKKGAGTDLSVDHPKAVCTGNNTEHMTLSSLLSAPFLGRCEETGAQSSHQSLGKAEPPLMTGHTECDSRVASHGTASHHIRSTAQIIALLKSKPTQGCRETEVTQCLSKFQASEDTDGVYNQKSTVLPALSGSPATRPVGKRQELPFAKGAVADRKGCSAEVLLNPAEQLCQKEVAEQGHDQKTNYFSGAVQDPCSTSSCFLPESSASRMSDSQFIPSSGNISYSASPVTSNRAPSGYREHLGTTGLQENSSVKLQSELQPRQNSNGVRGDLELPADTPLAEAGAEEEEFGPHGQGCSPGEEVMQVNFNLVDAFDFNAADSEELCERAVDELAEGEVLPQSPDRLKGEDVAQNAASRHACCEVGTLSKDGEAQRSTLDGENDGDHCAGCVSSQWCDSSDRGAGRTTGDSASQTRTGVELLGDGHNIKESNKSQLSTEATNSEKDLDGCTARTIRGSSQTQSTHSDLVPGDTNINRCHPETRMFEKMESTLCISRSRIISAMGERTEEDVEQLGCVNSLGADLGHFWGTKSGDIKPDSPLLAFPQTSGPGCGSVQCVAGDHQKVLGIAQEEDIPCSRSSVHPLGKGHSSPEETARGETKFENAESRNKACEGERTGTDSLKRPTVAEDASALPDLVNNITLLGALTQHSTALESLQKMEENSSVLHEAETSRETLKPCVKEEG